MSYSSVITRCPHCDMLVKFSASEICPSCNISGNSPITEDDLKRISSIKNSKFIKDNLSKKDYDSSTLMSSKRAIYIFYGALFVVIKLFMFAAYHAR